MIIIIAGNYREYTAYLSKNRLNPDTHRYISSVERIQGFRPADCDGYRVVGDLYSNPLAGELINLLESRNIRRIQE